MARILILLLGGVAAGSAATYYWIANHSRYGPSPAPSDSTAIHLGDAARGSPIEPDATHAGVADRAAFYARVAEADRATVEVFARTAAARPTDPDNRFVLDAALRRYVEIDPARALRFARELNGANRAFDLLGPLYEGWASIDRDAALDAVGRADDPSESRMAAMAVLRAFGDTEGAVERIATVVRGVDSNAFRVDAIGLRAESYPLTALREALAFSDRATRKSAAERALMFSARSAPGAAMAILDGIGDPDLKLALQATLLRNWDAGDVEGMLANLPRVDPATRNEILRAAPSRIARENPERAIELVEQMPLGQERQQMLTSVAREYARTNPEKALAWARRFDPPQPEIAGAVFDGLALSDPVRAFDLALTLEPAAARMSALQSAVQYGGRDGSQFAPLAGRVLALDNAPAQDAMLETLLQNWSVMSVKAAAEWLVANSDRVSPQLLLTMGERFGQRDPDATAAYLDRVPSAARGAWIGAIAQTYARSNPQQATSFLARFRGDSTYQSASVLVARAIAPYDPAMAARVLDGLDITVPALGTRPSPQELDMEGAVMITAQQWARTDPAAAVAWALGLRTDRARTGPLFAVSQVWTSTDPPSARDWILHLPVGADRDTALRGFVSSVPDVAILDVALMNAFSTAELRQRTLSGFAGLFARNDPQAARRLIDEYVTDPAMREAAQRQIEFASNRPAPRGLLPADPTLPTPAGSRLRP